MNICDYEGEWRELATLKCGVGGCELPPTHLREVNGEGGFVSNEFFCLSHAEQFLLILTWEETFWWKMRHILDWTRKVERGEAGKLVMVPSGWYERARAKMQHE